MYVVRSISFMRQLHFPVEFEVIGGVVVRRVVENDSRLTVGYSVNTDRDV